MKKLIFVSITSAVMFVSFVMAQGPGGGQRGPGGAGGRGTPAPPATGPIADMVTKITDAINKQDAAALTKLVTADAVLVDEDGHFDPVNQWIMKLTTTGSKTMTVLGGRGLSPLRVSESGDTAWAAFNYNLKETATPRGQSTASPNEINGIATIVFRKNGTDWQATLIHIAVKGLAITPH
jgi:ketosteroid isomerase-like protein